jgi:hypothetical protein
MKLQMIIIIELVRLHNNRSAGDSFSGVDASPAGETESVQYCFFLYIFRTIPE